MKINELYNTGKTWIKKQWEPHTAAYKIKERQNIEDILSTEVSDFTERQIEYPHEFKKGMPVKRVRPWAPKTDRSVSIVSDNYPNGGFIDMSYLCRVKQEKTEVHTDVFPNYITNANCEYYQVSHFAHLGTWNEGIEHCLLHPNENINGGGLIHTESSPANPLIKPFSKKETMAVRKLVYR